LQRGPIRYRPNQTILNEGEESDYVYLVIHGTVRACLIDEYGSRQIVAFYSAGDLFGMTSAAEHAISAEAVNETDLLLAKRSSLLSLAAHDSRISLLLMGLIARDLDTARKHAFLLKRSAVSRTGQFLMEQANRLSDGGEVNLPMTRSDIGAHLGLSIEAVSRALTKLEEAKAIKRTGRRDIVIRNHAALRAIVLLPTRNCL